MATRALLSGNWYRVRDLRPRLRGHVQIHRHAYRGEVWYVFEDRVGGRHHRFNFASYRVVHLMDGRRDLQAVWDLLSQQIDDDTPTQDDIIRLLGQLHAADLVHGDVSPDVAELFERRRKHVRRKWMARLANPVALRIPLFDPDALLARLARWMRPLDGRLGIALWLAVVLPALVMVPSHWSALTGNFNDQLLAADNLLLLAVLFPLVKVLHEAGHGLACKLRGGEVHETGVMLLAFYPVPYVDVSHSAAFPGKWHRALVGAAGMLTEVFIAALAFYFWLLLEPGLARSIAWNVAVLASVTTVVFNANPLLRFDGYYILSDLIEVPNLASRAGKHWQRLAERWVFGVRNPEPVPATAGERRWFVGFQPLSYGYRLYVAFAIAVFVAQQFFLVGVLLGIWTLAQGVLWPMFKGLRALATQPQFADRGPRIRVVFAGGAVLLGLGLFAVPVPFHTHGEGVLWLPDQAILRAQSPGFVRRLLAEPGAAVQAGQPVLEGVEPGLAARVAVQAARVEEVQAQIDGAWLVSQARVQQLQQELARERAALERLQDEARRLTLTAGVAGTLLIDRPVDLPGRFLRQGEVVGYLRTGNSPLVRVVVTQAQVDPVRLTTRAVEVRLPQDTGRSWRAELRRGVPAATRQLPSAALGALGGGPVATDPRDDKGLATLESVFEFELQLPDELVQRFLGSRVHVRFEHEAEPVGLRGWRAVRRSFLTLFHV